MEKEVGSWKRRKVEGGESENVVEEEEEHTYVHT